MLASEATRRAKAANAKAEKKGVSRSTEAKTLLIFIYMKIGELADSGKGRLSKRDIYQGDRKDVTAEVKAEINAALVAAGYEVFEDCIRWPV